MHIIPYRSGALDTVRGRFGASYFRGQILAAAVRGFEILLLWQRRANQRRALASLDDRMLCDLGLSRSRAAMESRKPFWRA